MDQARRQPFEGALTDKDQLKPKAKIVICNHDDGSSMLATVESGQYESTVLRGSFMVDLLLGDGRHKSVYLTDIGVVPYADTGFWNSTFSTMLVDQSVPESASKYGCVIGQ